MGLRPLVVSDFGFEFHQGHSCLSVVSVVCCQVEVSATGRSLVQRNYTGCVGDQLQHLPRHLLDLARWRSRLIKEERKKERKKEKRLLP